MMETVNAMTQIDALKLRHDMLLLYIGGAGCGVCKSMLSRLSVLLQKYPRIQAVKADLSDAPELAAGFGIFTVPAVILFVMGKETLREAGFISLTELERKIAKYIVVLDTPTPTV